MMNKKIFYFLLATTSLFAQSAGNSGLAFLKFGFGARNIAMSDLGVVAANDLTAINYNPSLIAINSKTQLTFSHNSLFQDLNSEMFAGSFSTLGLPVVVGVNATNIADIEIRTKPGDPEATFTAHYFASSISTAFRIYEKLYFGVSAKYIYENLFSDNANGWGFDLGANYQDLIDGLSVGASIRNLGSMNILRGESTKLPADLRLGAAYNFSVKSIKMDFTALFGFQKYTLEDGSHLHIGGEVIYDQMFALRLGFASGYDSKSISTGFGILWKGINLDYAFVPVKYGLGDSHIISLLYTF
jgi:hypothetical protein